MKFKGVSKKQGAFGKAVSAGEQVGWGLLMHMLMHARALLTFWSVVSLSHMRAAVLQLAGASAGMVRHTCTELSLI